MRETLSTADLLDLDKRHLWHPFTQMKHWMEEDQLVIARGQGMFLYDTDGRRYYDGVSSLWVNVHGHNRPELNEALKRQVDELAHSTLLGLANVPATLLAAELVKIAPAGLSRVFYSDCGSTAVEIALKIAYQYCQQTGRERRTRFIRFTEAYHGDTIGAVSVGGADLFHGKYKPLLFESIPAPYPDWFHEGGGKSREEYAEMCLLALEDLFRRHGEDVAAVIVEPLVQGAAGMHLMPPGYLKAVERLARENDILLICDEVATGFGRTGTMFACGREDVRPDLMCVAKGITAGYLPLAATLTSERVFEGFLGDFGEKKQFYHGHTYTGNPLACAVALASLRLFETDNLLEHTRANAALMEKELATWLVHPHVGDVRQCGTMAGIELVRSKSPVAFYDYGERLGHRVCMRARELGLLIRPLGDVLVLMPPLAITADELAEVLAITKRALVEVCAELD